MSAGVWKALAGIIAVLLLAVIALDQWQARREGLSSLFWTPGRPTAEARPAQTPPLPPAPPAPGGAPRIAVIVDDLGSRRDVFDLVREVGRPLAVGVLPGLPLSGWIAAEASRMRLEVDEIIDGKKAENNAPQLIVFRVSGNVWQVIAAANFARLEN